jgi:hypothetical protein
MEIIACEVAKVERERYGKYVANHGKDLNMSADAASRVWKVMTRDTERGIEAQV